MDVIKNLVVGQASRILNVLIVIDMAITLENAKKRGSYPIAFLPKF